MNKESGILKKNSIKYVTRASGIAVPVRHDERRAYYKDNYDLIAHYIPSEYSKQERYYVEDCKIDETLVSKNYADPELLALRIAHSEINVLPGKVIDSRRYKKTIQQQRKCRFCGKSYPEVTFKKDAHAISELIGNHSLLIWNECDDCNELFAKYESSLAEFYGPARTISQIEGKSRTRDGKRSSIPTYVDGKRTVSIEIGKTAEVIQEIQESGHVDFWNNEIVLNLEKQPYIPLDVFKALVAMALSIMPINEFNYFGTTRDWLIGKNEDYSVSNYASQVIMRFLPGPPQMDVQVWALRRKNVLKGGSGVFNVPYCIFVVEFSNCSIQIVVPNREKDAVLWGKTVSVPMFIASFEEYEELQSYGKPVNSKCDFSSKKIIRGEVMKMQVSYDKCENITENIETIDAFAGNEEFTPLYKMRKNKKEDE